MTLSGPVTAAHRCTIPAQTAATTANLSFTLAPFVGTVASVSFTPSAAITGATATKRTFTLENRAQDGTGTTVIATLDFITGTNAAAFDEVSFTLSGTPANLNVAAGDCLAVKEAVTSTGTANPGGVISIGYSRGEVGA